MQIRFCDDGKQFVFNRISAVLLRFFLYIQYHYYNNGGTMSGEVHNNEDKLASKTYNLSDEERADILDTIEKIESILDRKSMNSILSSLADLQIKALIKADLPLRFVKYYIDEIYISYKESVKNGKTESKEINEKTKKSYSS